MIKGGVESQAYFGFADGVDVALESPVVFRVLLLDRNKVTLDGKNQQFCIFPSR